MTKASSFGGTVTLLCRGDSLDVSPTTMKGKLGELRPRRAQLWLIIINSIQLIINSIQLIIIIDDYNQSSPQFASFYGRLQNIRTIR